MSLLVLIWHWSCPLGPLLFQLTGAFFKKKLYLFIYFKSYHCSTALLSESFSLSYLLHTSSHLPPSISLPSLFLPFRACWLSRFSFFVLCIGFCFGNKGRVMSSSFPSVTQSGGMTERRKMTRDRERVRRKDAAVWFREHCFISPQLSVRLLRRHRHSEGSELRRASSWKFTTVLLCFQKGYKYFIDGWMDGWTVGWMDGRTDR